MHGFLPSPNRSRRPMAPIILLVLPELFLIFPQIELKLLMVQVGFEPGTFRSRARRSNHYTSPCGRMCYVNAHMYKLCLNIDYRVSIYIAYWCTL